jgi:hypothetical protein
MKKRDIQKELNEARTTIAVFMESYNKSVPEGFPISSMKLLQKFKEQRQTLFKNGDEWSIDKHRKHFMDWLHSHRDE